MFRYKLRFNLGRGLHFMQWKLMDTYTGKVEYYDPEAVHFMLHDCKLVNQSSIANKIFRGEHKKVCSWVSFASYEIVTRESVVLTRPLKFNPRVSPNWRNGLSENVDNYLYKKLCTAGNAVFQIT
jgi:hypothetical protein